MHLLGLHGEGLRKGTAQRDTGAAQGDIERQKPGERAGGLRTVEHGGQYDRPEDELDALIPSRCHRALPST